MIHSGSNPLYIKIFIKFKVCFSYLFCNLFSRLDNKKNVSMYQLLKNIGKTWLKSETFTCDNDTNHGLGRKTLYLVW